MTCIWTCVRTNEEQSQPLLHSCYKDTLFGTPSVPKCTPQLLGKLILMVEPGSILEPGQSGRRPGWAHILPAWEGNAGPGWPGWEMLQTKPFWQSVCIPANPTGFSGKITKNWHPSRYTGEFIKSTGFSKNRMYRHKPRSYTCGVL